MPSRHCLHHSARRIGNISTCSRRNAPLRTSLHLRRKRRKDSRRAESHLRRHHLRPVRRKLLPGTIWRNRPVHPSRLSIPTNRRDAHQLPLAAIQLVDAGLRVRRPRIRAGSLPPRGRGQVPVFLLRRLHATALNSREAKRLWDLHAHELDWRSAYDVRPPVPLWYSNEIKQCQRLSLGIGVSICSSNSVFSWIPPLPLLLPLRSCALCVD
jgi:hypothetical protein